MAYNFQPLQNVMNNWLPAHIGVSDIDAEPNNITCIAGGTEMLRVADDGFYVRGVRVEADDQEAATVYNAFKEFLVWNRLSRD